MEITAVTFPGAASVHAWLPVLILLIKPCILQRGVASCCKSQACKLLQHTVALQPCAGQTTCVRLQAQTWWKSGARIWCLGLRSLQTYGQQRPLLAWSASANGLGLCRSCLWKHSMQLRLM